MKHEKKKTDPKEARPALSAEVEAVRYGRGPTVEGTTQVVREVPLTIFLNDQEIITLLASADHLDELIVGFLHSEGWLTSKEDLRSVRVDPEQGLAHVETLSRPELTEKLFEKRTITSGCGKGTTFYHGLDALRCSPVTSSLQVPAEVILDLMETLNTRSELYKATHGAHAVALCSTESILIFREDIGRHNAIDKISGRVLLDAVRTDDKVVLTTGRISSEILLKAAKLGVPVLVSRSAPTDLALDLAGRLNITVVGLVRQGRLLVYSGRARIELPGE